MTGDSLGIALVIWTGGYGGSETFTTALAAGLRRMGVEATVVFVTEPGRLEQRLLDSDVPYVRLGHSRGRDILLAPRSFAREVAAAGPDGVILPERGFLPATLRAGGYRGTIVAVEHGHLLQMPSLPLGRRLLRRVDRVVGRLGTDVEVAVSDYVLARLGSWRGGRTVRIHNGLDLRGLKPVAMPACDQPLVAGWIGRMIAGKGLETLLEALRRTTGDVVVRIGGGGPHEQDARDRASRLGVEDRVEFVGWVDDVGAFWSRCHLAVLPAVAPESFCMAAVEAMAYGKPVVATTAGALPEVIDEAGVLVEPGDAAALATALDRFAAAPERCASDGAVARRYCESRFDIGSCANAYANLFIEARGSR